MKKGIQDLLFEYDNGLIRCGLNADNVDYDKLSVLRIETWKKLEEIIKNKLKNSR